MAVEPDAIYVHDNDVWTSAGVTAGIDLALALVADDHGARAAGEVARQLVVYLRRSGGQAQFSAVLAAQSSDHEPVRDVLTWLTDNLTADLSIPALAAQANLSDRQFSRVFKAEVGLTPAEHVEAVRMEAACRLLETTSSSVEQIATICGFGVPETMIGGPSTQQHGIRRHSNHGIVGACPERSPVPGSPPAFFNGRRYRVASRTRFSS